MSKVTRFNARRFQRFQEACRQFDQAAIQPGLAVPTLGIQRVADIEANAVFFHEQIAAFFLTCVISETFFSARARIFFAVNLPDAP
jgi:hypothetical protein